MPAPLCEHCTYDLSGTAAVNFIALCPECGKPSDIRKTPEPTFPWWHTPLALLVGCGTYILIFSACLLTHVFSKNTPEPITIASALGAPAISAAASILFLRRNYAALWQHRYGTTHWPRRGLISLAVDWLLWSFVLGFLPYMVFGLISWLWP